MIALGSGDPTRFICSGMIAQAFQSIHYPILPSITTLGSGAARSEIMRIRHSSLFVPRDFDISPFFEVVKPNIEQGFDYRRTRWAESLSDQPFPSVKGQTVGAIPDEASVAQPRNVSCATTAKDVSITLASSSQMPAIPKTSGSLPHNEAQNDEDPGQHGKPGWQEAHGNEECDCFGTFGDSAEIMDSLVGKGERSEAAALGDDGEHQETGGRFHEANK